MILLACCFIGGPSPSPYCRDRPHVDLSSILIVSRSRAVQHRALCTGQYMEIHRTNHKPNQKDLHLRLLQILSLENHNSCFVMGLILLCQVVSLSPSPLPIRNLQLGSAKLWGQVALGTRRWKKTKHKMTKGSTNTCCVSILGCCLDLQTKVFFSSIALVYVSI